MVNLMKRLIRVVIFLLVWFFLTPQQALGAATLKLSPETLTIAKEATFTVSILVSTGSEAINFVSANLNFPKDKLKFEAFDENQTFITIWPEKSYNNDLGRIELAGALYNPGISGSDLKFIGLRFKAIGNSSDQAIVSFRDSSEVYRLSDTVNILASKTNGTYTIGSSTLSSTPQPTLTSSPSVSPGITVRPTNLPSETLTPTLAVGGLESVTVTNAPVAGDELPKTGQITPSVTFLGFGLIIVSSGIFIGRQHKRHSQS